MSETIMKNMRVYKKRCNILKNLLKVKYLDHEFKTIQYEGDILVIVDFKFSMTLLEDSTFEELVRIVDKRLCGDIPDECLICCEKYETGLNSRVPCPRCSNCYCGGCYINIFKNGKGVIKCPYCMYKIGQAMPPFYVNAGIKEIKRKLNN